jgi:membrane protein implicated in regulation of membrane protease activity
VKFVWAIIALLYAVLNIYVGYLFVTAATGAKLSQKGILLQAPPLLGGLALAVLALPLLWNCIRLITAKTPRY